MRWRASATRFAILHALDRRKARLASFRTAGERLPLEDVLTSTIFGTLEFVDAEARRWVLESLFERFGAQLPQGGDLQIEFWPTRTQRKLRARTIEPDLVIKDAEGAVAIVEVKWNAPLDIHELAAQWHSLSKIEHRRACHVLLVRHKAPYAGDVAADRLMLSKLGIRRWPIVVACWSDLSSALARLASNHKCPPGVSAWAMRANRLIRHEDSQCFAGWPELELAEVPLARWRSTGRFTRLVPAPLLKWRDR